MIFTSLLIPFVHRAFIFYLIFRKSEKYFCISHKISRRETIGYRLYKQLRMLSALRKSAVKELITFFADFSHGSAGFAMCERGCWLDELLTAAFDGEVQRLRRTLNAKLAIVSARDKSARTALIFSYFCVSTLLFESRTTARQGRARREIRLGCHFPTRYFDVGRIKNYNSHEVPHENFQRLQASCFPLGHSMIPALLCK